MSDNNRSVDSEQSRNLRLRQPYAVALHADFQTGLAVGRPVNDDLPSVHTNKYRKIRLHLKIFPAFGFLARNRYLCTVMQGDTAAAQANGQAGARPCKMTVGDAGDGSRKNRRNSLIYIGLTFVRKHLLSALFSPRKRTFFWTVRRKQEYFNLFINTLY